MSGIDPLAALASEAVAAARAAIGEATLQLGDLVRATVLPAESGIDRIELFGAPLRAQLPAGIHPGEKLSLQVVAFAGDRVVMRVHAPALTPAPERTSPQEPLPRREERQTLQLRQIVIERREAPVQARIAMSRLPVPQSQKQIVSGAPRPHIVPHEPAEVTVLRRIRVPIAPPTLAAARIVAEAAHRLPRVYARLDALLARVLSPSPTVATLRSLLSFLAKIDPSNARALPEQIASFVSHVVEGPERKLVQIARASLDPEIAVAYDEHARAVERAVAIEHDLKTVLLSVAQSPPKGAPHQLAQAVHEAIVATTAVQLGTLSAQQSEPNAVVLSLPAFFYEGGRPAEIRISKDAGNAKQRSNADDFHIAFVLDTRTMGTIAIDLQTAGRAVNVNVKTERASAVRRFRATFEDLRARLERLRYRVTAMDAGIARAKQNPLKVDLHA